MYSLQGCYSFDNDICLNNIFDKKSDFSSVNNCKNIAKFNNSPFFIMTNGNINDGSCFLGKDISINENIKHLSNDTRKLKIENISNKNIKNIDNICGYNNLSTKNDVYAGSNSYSLYTSADSMLVYNNENILKEKYELPSYYSNSLDNLNKDFSNIITNLKNSYIDYIKSKAEDQAFNDIINNPKIIISKKENIIQILNDLLYLDKNYNNLINNISKNSEIVFSKLNIFRTSSKLFSNELDNNKKELEDLLNMNRGDNEELLSNNLKKVVYFLNNIFLIIIILIFLFIKKNK